SSAASAWASKGCRSTTVVATSGSIPRIQAAGTRGTGFPYQFPGAHGKACERSEAEAVSNELVYQLRAEERGGDHARDGGELHDVAGHHATRRELGPQEARRLVPRQPARLGGAGGGHDGRVEPVHVDRDVDGIAQRGHHAIDPVA